MYNKQLNPNVDINATCGSDHILDFTDYGFLVHYEHFNNLFISIKKWKIEIDLSWKTK